MPSLCPGGDLCCAPTQPLLLMPGQEADPQQAMLLFPITQTHCTRTMATPLSRPGTHPIHALGMVTLPASLVAGFQCLLACFFAGLRTQEGLDFSVWPGSGMEGPVQHKYFYRASLPALCSLVNRTLPARLRS